MVYDNLKDILERSPLFQGVDEQTCDFLGSIAARMRFDAGHFLFLAGEEANRFFLLVEGTVAVEIAGHGGGPITFETLGPGEAIGWSWLAPPHRWQFEALVVEPAEVVVFDAVSLRARFADHPTFELEMLRRMYQLMARRLTVARDRIVSLYN